jgi:tRNA G37 N-methylase Trm5
MKLEDFKISPLWETEAGLKAKENIYNEIWVDNEYSRFGVDIEVGDIVVDCGANIGMFSQFAIHKGAKKVFSYECEDEEYKYLKINTSSNDNIITTQGYVSDLEYTIEKIINDNNLEFIDYLKIDIEGSEYGLLLNEKDDVLKKVKKIAIELHIFGMFNGSSEYYDKSFRIIEKLSLCGFKISLEQVIKNTNLFMLYAIR